MKKITFLVLTLVFSTVNMFSQATVAEILSSGTVDVDWSQKSTAIISSNTQTRAIVETFDNRSDFEDACNAVLVLENFAGGPGSVQVCGPVISSAANGCFSAGEIVDGIQITFGGGNGTDTVYAPAGGFGNPDPIVGSNTFIDFTIINFTGGDVNSAAMDVYPLVSGGAVQVRIYGTGGLIDTYDVNFGAGGFFGFIADEEILSIELEDLTGANAELIGMLVFGECEVLSTNESLIAQVSVFPNPSSGFINIKAPSSMEIKEVIVYDLLGRNTGAAFSNGIINVSNLNRGIYMVSIKTSEGTLTQKVVKK